MISESDVFVNVSEETSKRLDDITKDIDKILVFNSGEMFNSLGNVSENLESKMSSLQKVLDDVNNKMEDFKYKWLQETKKIINKETKSFTGHVMSGNHKVALINDNTLVEILDYDRCPLYLIRTENFIEWLNSRSIDLHRTNSRMLRKAVRLKDEIESSIVLRVRAVTVTDNYWVREIGCNLSWEDVRFKTEHMAETALTGMFDNNEVASAYTPEFTNIGSFEKCWRFNGKEWFLVKEANPLAMFSEIFIEKLGASFNYDMASYVRYSNNYIATKDFTESNKYNFEPISALTDDEEDYGNVINILSNFGLNFVRDYLKLIFMDALIQNPDRHGFNLGILRDADTGEVLRLAPNYDNNLALISRGYPTTIPNKNNRLIKDFVDVALNNSLFNLPFVDRETLFNLVNTVSIETGVAVDVDFVIDYIMDNYKIIKNML